LHGFAICAAGTKDRQDVLLTRVGMVPVSGIGPQTKITDFVCWQRVGGVAQAKANDQDHQANKNESELDMKSPVAGPRAIS
jgi:hypothetical protein